MRLSLLFFPFLTYLCSVSIPRPAHLFLKWVQRAPTDQLPCPVFERQVTPRRQRRAAAADLATDRPTDPKLAIKPTTDKCSPWELCRARRSLFHLSLSPLNFPCIFLHPSRSAASSAKSADFFSVETLRGAGKCSTALPRGSDIPFMPSREASPWLLCILRREVACVRLFKAVAAAAGAVRAQREGSSLSVCVRASFSFHETRDRQCLTPGNAAENASYSRVSKSRKITLFKSTVGRLFIRSETVRETWENKH